MTKGKKFIALGMLESGMLKAVFNPRAADAIVPEFLREQLQSSFDYGLDLPIPIPDLHIDDKGITATLSFSLTPFKTFLPWSCIFVLTSSTAQFQSQAVWADDVPGALRDEVEASEEEPQAAAVGALAAAPAKRERPSWMSLVP